MKAIVYCKACSEHIGEVHAADPEHLGLLLTEKLLATHAEPKHGAHFQHALEFEIFNGGVLLLRCHNANCLQKKRQRLQFLPDFLVNSASLAFHSDHEGHPFEGFYRGWHWMSPTVERKYRSAQATSRR